MVTAPLNDGAAAFAHAAARLRADMAGALRSNAGAIGRTILRTRGLLPSPSAEGDRRERDRIAGIRRQLAAEQVRMGRR
ncbi:hypothetical protein PUR29_36435 [Methylobacterium ajmalii]|uniref:Uncharacterized protein n=1 Tax=Methylobacterium ajmalii TaxID=2738439 RepID=A0ABV0A680_9HYPH